MRKIGLLATILLLLLGAHTATAHRPEAGNPEGVTQIPDPTTSFAYYRQLTGSDSVHVYQFEGQAGTFFHAGINIPQLEGLEEYGVNMALLGPGLPTLAPEDLPFDQSSQRPGMPVLLPEWARTTGMLSPKGILVKDTPGEDFFEPFTQTSYWGRQVLEIDLPETGGYTLLIWNDDHQSGKYVLDTGTREVFGPADLLQFPAWWLETRVYFEQGPTLRATAAAVAALALLGLIYTRRAYAARRVQ